MDLNGPAVTATPSLSGDRDGLLSIADETPASDQPRDTPEEGADRQGAPEPLPLLLLVEDNRADVYLVQRALDHHHVRVRLTVLDDGEDALKYFERADANPDVPCPAAVLLDLNLPKKSGSEVLEKLRASQRCRRVPVIVLTSSDSQEDRRRTAELGADQYFRKPSSYQEFLQIGDVLNKLLEGTRK